MSAKRARAWLATRTELWARSARMLGVPATLRRSLEVLLRERPELDRAFDLRHRTDTAGRVLPAQLGIQEGQARSQAVVYLPSPARVTRYLLDALALDASCWSFVDFGAGKGRVLLVAAERPFREVIGVELSPHLHAVAQRNLQRYRGPANLQAIRLQLGDARQLPLPAHDTVFHFYHPFGAPILRQVLQRIQVSLERHPRRVRIVYLGAFSEVMLVFAEFRFLRQTRFEQCLEPKYSWALFEAGG